MKVVILAGGLGTRLSEETSLRPKPMVEIGGRPSLWHIMKLYSHYGFNDFVICLGYKGYVIKEFFHHYYMHQADITVDLRNNTTEYNSSFAEPWRITMVDTGQNTMTGGRILRIRKYIEEDTFLLTYGDGLSNVDIGALVAHHESKSPLATLTAVQPSGKFGALSFGDNDLINSFREKPTGDGAWINGGFFVLSTHIFDYLKRGDDTIWEREPLESLAKDGRLGAYKHRGFWQPMDTLKERQDLEELWAAGNAPWKVWDDR